LTSLHITRYFQRRRQEGTGGVTISAQVGCYLASDRLGNNQVVPLLSASGFDGAVGSKLRLSGRAFGIGLHVEEVIIERMPPQRKVWETVGASRE